MKITLLLCVAVGIAAASALDFPTPKELRQRVCRIDPGVCDMDAGTAPRDTTTVPRSMTALYHAVFEWAIDAAGVAFGLPGAVTQELHYLRQNDPEALYAKLRSAQEQYKAAKGERPRLNDMWAPYFGFLPKFHGNALLNSTYTFDTPCFGEVKVSPVLATVGGQTTVEVNVDFDQKKELLCEERLYFSMGAMAHDIEGSAPGRYAFPFDVTLDILNPALKWDMETNGIRVYRFHSAKIDRMVDIIATVLLFYPMLTNKVEGLPAKMNVDYLSNYTLLKPYPVPRPQGAQRVNLTPGVDVKTGDLFAKLDLNGLGTTEMVGQGTTSGHVAFALLNTSSNEMMVCESVIKGIICTEYNQWVEGMETAGLGIVMVPLAKEFSDSFNLTAAWDWVNANYGNEYGYHNFFFGWIDTEEDNYPCFAPGYDRCLTWAHVDLVMRVIDSVLPSLATKFFGEALNHRAGTAGLRIPDVLWQAAVQKGLTGPQLMKVPEQDNWKYSITNLYRNGTFQGPSQVCSVLGCNVLRAAGVFDSIHGDFQCAELSVWDVFSLKIFDESRMNSGRPQACIAADPANPLCQLTGEWTFNLLSDVNTRTPFVNISNYCAGKGPHPYNRTGCFSP